MLRIYGEDEEEKVEYCALEGETMEEASHEEDVDGYEEQVIVVL